MRLLPLNLFDPVFQPLLGKRVGVVDGIGNVGDFLLYTATRQLLRTYGVEFTTVNLAAGDVPSGVDCLLLFAGGNMGYPPCTAIRRQAFETGLPLYQLPQSWILYEQWPFEKVFVREAASQQIYPLATLAPDLALGYDFPEPQPNSHTIPLGVFCRNNGHAMFAGQGSGDPVDVCHSVEDYCQFAAKYKHVVTDRLHFAITAMGMGCSTTLLPVAYHKNRSMWETWLRDLGCEWQDQP